MGVIHSRAAQPFLRRLLTAVAVHAIYYCYYHDYWKNDAAAAAAKMMKKKYENKTPA